ncbi:unnamed protein product [Adineta steineri]|uniref:Uncharacterized protein n=1 Tax=Adineta steineri TaxID=433720 RepID=A0A814RE17_9BILA|nr:unnamed protein product [Adineta steineri]
MTSSNILLEPIAVIGIAYKFAESQDAGSATTIDRFDLKSFTAHMLNMDNNGQLRQQLLRVGSVDPCHRSFVLKFVDLLDDAGYSVKKMSDDGLALLLLKQLSDAERDGDPIEANYLIKSNLGHTEGAAGVASLIKVAMCMYHRGITGGTTTHSIIEEYQPINKTSIENGHIDDGNHIKSKQYFIFIFSTFLQRISQQLLLKRTISYTHSAIFVFLNRQQLQEQINAFLTEQISPGFSIISRPTKPLVQKICFVFSGQGPQWWAMGRLLYESEPLFTKWINLIDGEMTKINNDEWRLLEELIKKKNERESCINDTNIAQPTLFAIQVALAALFVS